jgi:hypothetical protein
MDVILITIGIIANILIFYFVMKNLYTKNRLKGAYGMQGKQGDIGPEGLRGPKGPGGPQGPRGNDGPQGPQGQQGKYGERIYCSSIDCNDKRIIRRDPDDPNSEQIWPSRDCRKSLYTDSITDTTTNGWCGRNWVWEKNTVASCNNNSTQNGWYGNVWDDGSVSEENNQTYKWSTVVQTNLKKEELGTHFAPSTADCNSIVDERSGNCPTVSRNSKCRDLTTKSVHPAEGSCRNETREKLNNNALMFCCGQDGQDIEDNRGSACLVTGKTNGNYTHSVDRYNKCTNGPIKVRDTNNKIYRNASQPAVQGGDVTHENVRSWCIGKWGCCDAMGGKKRYQNENWRQSYCRNLHSGFIEKDSITTREIDRLKELGQFDGNPPVPYNRETDTSIRGPYNNFNCVDVKWKKIWLGDPKMNCSNGKCQPLKTKTYSDDGSNKLGQEYRWEAIPVDRISTMSYTECSRKKNRRVPGCVMKTLPKTYIKCCKMNTNGKCIGGPIDCSGFAENSRVKIRQ